MDGHDSHEAGHDLQPVGHESEDLEPDSTEAHSHSHATTQVEKLPPAELAFSDHPAAQVAAQLHQAISAGAVDTLRSLIAPEVLIFESGGVETSLAEYEGHHMPADMAFMKGMKQELLLRRVVEAGDFAIVVTQSRIHGVAKEQDFDISSTETLLMKNVDGQWQIEHIHWSSD
jgi:ketosteroid isomerase-like protein